MTGEDLKKAVLQAAVQGKLSEQLDTDTPAAELLAGIRTKRKELTGSGELRFPKDGESVIYRDERGDHWERRIDKKGKVLSDTCIEEEVPFEIPLGWQWARLSSVGFLVRGSGIKKTEVTADGLPCVRYGELYTTYRESIAEPKSHTSKNVYDSAKKLEPGEVLMTLTGENNIDIGRAVYNASGSTISYGGDLIALKGAVCNGAFMASLINSATVSTQRTAAATGNIIVHLSAEKVGGFLVPIPPLEEQERIVAKLAEVMPLIEEYGRLQEQRDKLDAELPEKLRKAVLQAGVEGKLSEQIPSEKTGADLLNELGFAASTIEDEPCDIPDSWCWTTIEGINAYKSCSVNPASRPEDDFELYSVPTMPSGLPEFVKGKEIKSSKPAVKRGDILLCKINPHLNRVWHVEGHSDATLIASSEWIIIRAQGLNRAYLTYALSSPYFRELMQENITGVGGSLRRAQPKLVKNYPIPIPPLEEQERIVSKLAEVMPLIEGLGR